jgi:hypothetical protein
VTTSIGFCRNQDVGDVMQFIRDYWKEGHILGTHRGLFDWQYRDPAADRYNFVLCRRDSDGELLGVLGFIPTTLYDPSLVDNAVVWLALWRVRPDSGITGLGMFLHQYLVDHTPHVSSAVSGLNKMSQRLMAGLGYRPEVLQHYYLPNPTIKSFHVARLAEAPAAAGDRSLGKSLEQVSEDFLLTHTEWAIGDRSHAVPAKSPTYFLRRFLEHPYYDYDVYAVREGNECVGLVAVRQITHEDHRVLRIVDYWGPSDGLPGLSGALRDLVADTGAEYIDCLCWGLREEVFIQEGWARLDIAGDTIIPHYFEPLEMQNVQTRVAFKALTGGQFLFFKADGDQDRPSRLPA